MKIEEQKEGTKNTSQAIYNNNYSKNLTDFL